MSTDLHQAQRQMAAYLRDPKGSSPPGNIEARRMHIYRDLVYRNIEGFISSAFPILRSLYDDEAWENRVRAFIAVHRCKTPLFLRISEEFLGFLAERPAGELRPFEAELAHYEWLELAVDVAEGEVPAVLSAVPKSGLSAIMAHLSPTARLGSYVYPVHRIGSSFQPEAAGDPTFLLVYRDRESRVQFMELSPGSARLIQEVRDGVDSSVAELLQRLATDWGMAPEQLQDFGWAQLQNFNEAGVIALDDSNV
ncbi:putative DNA-binding domain-containing protein [Congregibacter variabilis]|uniref:DNA-binding domain-containing protein n=1 Tax=Congregibacter variabilis TaxID=3081200 RepID=A0ABZ0I6K0_9GAMM|nr:putative DNA-binding domain-containing protein [Congregibacter sp. IMCC43200]